ncbi:MAG: PEFG-CTERM sorting domain-containing protein [Nitrosopumilaceae archaeon]|nr:PEFG-CTERM sorting domain-containing protein [Nitrosopumilaceae archaeon]
MQIKKTTISIISALTVILIFSLPNAYSESVTVSLPQGTSVPGCETTNECFIPERVLLELGDTVIWSNDDSAAHTVTAGSASSGPSGVFDSSLFMAGTTFSYTFEEKGEFPYFCMVHPWMEGIVLVGETMAKQPGTNPGPEMNEKEMITLDYQITGGKVIHITPDIDANSLIIGLETTSSGKFTATLPRDIIDAKIGNEDDDFFILIDGEEVVFEERKTSTDRTVEILFPLGTEEIEIIGTHVVPEFGAVAGVILAIAITSIIVISSKSKQTIFPKI